jgi:hypothetical protein
MITEKSIAEQYQIGDRVIYMPEGILTTITGYKWETYVEKPPAIIAYLLGCGIGISADYLCRAPSMDGELPKLTPEALRKMGVRSFGPGGLT